MIGPIVRALARQKIPALLMVLETAFGFAVAVHASGLALHYARAAAAPRGIDTRSLLLAMTERDGPSFASRGEREAAVRRDTEALARVVGVRGAAEASSAPFNITHRELVEATSPGGPSALAWMLDDRGGVAAVLGLAPLEGRLLTPGDAADAASTPAVVTQALAARLFPDGRAIGQIVRRSARQKPLAIVGVVPPFRAALGPDADSVLFAAEGPPLGRTLSYLIRIEPDGDDGDDGEDRDGDDRVGARVREALERADPRRVVLVRALDEGAELDTHTNRGAGALALTLIGMMLVVVFLGRIGMASLLVAERRQALGIRRALGATRADVARLILVENALLTTAGLAVGAAALAGLRAAARAVAPELDLPLDPRAAALVAVAVWLAGMAAALLPALRASAVSPAEASRS
ncbi:FtsX-like permease family protein [Sorangium atrum]|uniref:FtsX-like permease family protein n=1 Tax=Sorangium atrum TaxID=2995308 RepID=A0ABT5BZF8_9BACT|nr:FtsX-like permease family protein [Sorangium aterium]MDC0679545.1 FtsX-like permease family protein [Sorangium aterium]